MAAMFTARHHAAIAKVIAAADRYDDGELIGDGLVADIVKMFAADNPNFNAAKFEAAAETDAYGDYCRAKEDIREEPLTREEWEELNATA